ncbi:hypothetical protein NQZ68_020338 [Dissostichus eleginoides]|nr:hypothetical protein NQZ68_020338 [Dissostichus eleginoides]
MRGGRLEVFSSRGLEEKRGDVETEKRRGGEHAAGISASAALDSECEGSQPVMDGMADARVRVVISVPGAIWKRARQGGDPQLSPSQKTVAGGGQILSGRRQVCSGRTDGLCSCSPRTAAPDRGKQASCWEVSGRRRACSRAADRTARQRPRSALINEGI